MICFFCQWKTYPGVFWSTEAMAVAKFHGLFSAILLSTLVRFSRALLSGKRRTSSAGVSGC